MAAVVLVVWVPFEPRVSQPLVDVRTSASRPVLLTNIGSVLLGFSMFGNLLTTTQQLQLPLTAAVYLRRHGRRRRAVHGARWARDGPARAGLGADHPAVGAKVTLIVGCGAMASGYVARVFLTGAVWHVILGSTVTSSSTAIA